jgi:hypothetical protein
MVPLGEPIGCEAVSVAPTAKHNAKHPTEKRTAAILLCHSIATPIPNQLERLASIAPHHLCPRDKHLFPFLLQLLREMRFPGN